MVLYIISFKKFLSKKYTKVSIKNTFFLCCFKLFNAAVIISKHKQHQMTDVRITNGELHEMKMEDAGLQPILGHGL
jgi:hypothetical protein